LVWSGKWFIQPNTEWILTSSHSFAHQAAASKAAKHLTSFAYIYTPARYLWAPQVDPRGERLAVKVAGIILKPLDRARAQKTDYIAVLTHYIAERVEKAWGRESRVIYPPV